MPPPAETPPLPACAEDVKDITSFSEAVGKLVSAINTAVNDGKSVTAANKRLICNAAEEIRRATRLLSSLPTPASTSAPTAIATPREEGLSSTLTQEIISCVREEIRGEMAQLKNIVTSQARTYSQAIRGEPASQPGRAKSGPATQPPSSYSKPAIIITPKGEVKSKQDAIEAFKKSISFRASSYAPARVQTVSNGKLRVEFDNVEQQEDTLKRLSNSTQVSAEPARKLNPMVILKGISRDVPSEHIVDILKEQNSELTEIIKVEDDLRLRFKRDNRNPSLYNAVFLAHPRVYRAMMDMTRVSLDHQRVYVDEFSPFIQCHKCLQFGHMRTKCESTVRPCAHCAETTHSIDRCPLREKPFTARCFNCTSHNLKFQTRLDTRHRANSNQCQRLRIMQEKITNRVDYGY